MSVRNLEHLFRPKSVAVIGASNRPHSVGNTIMHNLLEGGFAGQVMPVNPKHEAVAGVLTYPDVGGLPMTPDLAVICTPATMVPGLIAELGARGTKAVVVLTAGLSREKDDAVRTLQDAMLKAARPNLLRILGPNCLGLLIPGIGLNASSAHTDAAQGKVSVVHQSGALCTALLDYLGGDPTTRSESRSVFSVPASANPFLIVAVVGAQAIHIGALYFPGLDRLLDVAPVNLLEWIVVAATAAALIVVMEAYKRLANGLIESATESNRRAG